MHLGILFLFFDEASMEAHTVSVELGSISLDFLLVNASFFQIRLLMPKCRILLCFMLTKSCRFVNERKQRCERTIIHTTFYKLACSFAPDLLHPNSLGLILLRFYPRPRCRSHFRQRGAARKPRHLCSVSQSITLQPTRKPSLDILPVLWYSAPNTKSLIVCPVVLQLHLSSLRRLYIRRNYTSTRQRCLPRRSTLGRLTLSC